MKQIHYFLVTITLLFSGIASLYAQSNAANGGKEFYISYFCQVFGVPTLQLQVVVEKACTITAQYNNQPSVYWNNWNNAFVSPGIYTADVLYNNVVNEPPVGSGETTSRTLTLTSTENVCVYAINYYPASSDATCVLPISAWGTEYRLAMGVPIFGGQSVYAVVANVNNTIVTLHDNSTITLNKNEVYHFLSAGSGGVDIMTGMKISATKPVALFSGATAAMTPGFFDGCSEGFGSGSADHTYEQLWSVDKWGKYFFAFPVLTPNGAGNWGGMLALVAHENGTNVTVSGDINDGTPLYYELDAGEKQPVCYVMSGLTRIVSNKPIMVYLVLPDPCVMSILPTDQRIQHALVAPFILTGATAINQHGIDMLVPAAYWEQTVIKHDGVVVPNSLYTVNTSTHFPDWYHIRRNLDNVDIAIDVTCPGGFLAYISGNGEAESYAFCAGAGAYNLQNYFTIQEKGTTLDTYYENTTEETHTFETTDIIVVKRTVETPFDTVSWLINDTPYSISENNNVTNTLNFPASALHSGENAITMSVRFTGTNTDSIYTGKVWLEVTKLVEFYANNIHHENLQDTIFCANNVNFNAKIEGINEEYTIKWYIKGVEEVAAQNKETWNKTFEADTYRVKLEVKSTLGETTSVEGMLHIGAVITTTPMPETYGFTTGDGCYTVGDTVTITATPYSGYEFVNWTKDGAQISPSSTFSFFAVITQDLVANFQPENYIDSLDFDTYCPTLWNNTFMLNLRKLREEGYIVTGCKWFKNGKEEPDSGTYDEFSYSAGPKITDTLECSPTFYQFQLTTQNFGTLYSTIKRITKSSASAKLSVYPNPLYSGERLMISGTSKEYPIYVYNYQGVCVKKIPAKDTLTTLELDLPKGIYLIHTNNKTEKILIMNN